jgi:hypothetical protein
MSDLLDAEFLRENEFEVDEHGVGGCNLENGIMEESTAII